MVKRLRHIFHTIDRGKFYDINNSYINGKTEKLTQCIRRLVPSIGTKWNQSSETKLTSMILKVIIGK